MASVPVTGEDFVDREEALRALLDAFASLVAGAPRWVALLGPRKVGKTSLLLEAARRAPAAVDVAVMDVMDRLPIDLEAFRRLALLSVDALLAGAAGGSLARLAHVPARYRALLNRAASATRLPPSLHSDLDALVEEDATPDVVKRWLDLPEEVAAATGRRLIVGIDEVQEMASLRAGRFEPFPVMRASWQRHQHVAYVISSSAPSMMRELVTSRHSPFFQHFQLVEVGPLSASDAMLLMASRAPEGHEIDETLAARVVNVVGGHPFYLQLVGEALMAVAPPLDVQQLKAVVQGLVFSRTGRLALHFQNDYTRTVGNASTLAATLEAVATQGPARLTDVARQIGASTASTARYLERLGDLIARGDDGRYSVPDPLFAAWLQWRAPGGAVVPMSVVGDEAELAVARHLSDFGFDLVYQSRGSRGAFDLLAIRGADQLGLQVKRAALPLRFAKHEWKRMEADAERWGWHWAIAAVSAEGKVALLDPARARPGRELRLADEASIDNVLEWIDAAG